MFIALTHNLPVSFFFLGCFFLLWWAGELKLKTGFVLVFLTRLKAMGEEAEE